MNRRGFSPIVIIGIIAVMVVAGASIWYFSVQRNFISPSGVACTQEAKQCPDGSYVGRTGPNCEFAACPTVMASSTASTTLDTSNWQRFIDSQYGLTAKYPANWYLNGSIATGGTADVFDSFPASQAAHGSWIFEGSGEITIYRSSSSLQQVMNSELSGESATSSVIIVDGTQGLKASYDTYDSKNVDQKFVGIFIPHDGFVYEISLDDYGYPQSVDIFDTFLASIGFTQQNKTVFHTND
jgi:hypothetical protein